MPPFTVRGRISQPLHNATNRLRFTAMIDGQRARRSRYCDQGDHKCRKFSCGRLLKRGNELTSIGSGSTAGADRFINRPSRARTDGVPRMTYYFDISGGSKTGSTLRELKRLLAFLGDGCPTLQRDCDEAESFQAMKGHKIGWRITARFPWRWRSACVARWGSIGAWGLAWLTVS